MALPKAYITCNQVEILLVGPDVPKNSCVVWTAPISLSAWWYEGNWMVNEKGVKFEAYWLFEKSGRPLKLLKGLGCWGNRWRTKVQVTESKLHDEWDRICLFLFLFKYVSLPHVWNLHKSKNLWWISYSRWNTNKVEIYLMKQITLEMLCNWACFSCHVCLIYSLTLSPSTIFWARYSFLWTGFIFWLHKEKLCFFFHSPILIILPGIQSTRISGFLMHKHTLVGFYEPWAPYGASPSIFLCNSWRLWKN